MMSLKVQKMERQDIYIYINIYVYKYSNVFKQYVSILFGQGSRPKGGHGPWGYQRAWDERRENADFGCPDPHPNHVARKKQDPHDMFLFVPPKMNGVTLRVIHILYIYIYI